MDFQITSSTRIYPSLATSNSGLCQPPELPLSRSAHVSFKTESGIIATCGGSNDNTQFTTCVVLASSPTSNTLEWVSHKSVPDMPDFREVPASVVMCDGVYVLGGQSSGNSSFRLNNGVWNQGPTLPGNFLAPCSVKISQTSFLLIGGGFSRPESQQVQEYDIGSKIWQPVNSWPNLTQGRRYHSCSKIGDNVVVAGGMIMVWPCQAQK